MRTGTAAPAGQVDGPDTREARVSIGHHGATPGRHDDRSARSIAGRGRKGLRLIPLSQPIPEARPQPEIAARSAEPAPRTCARVRAQALLAWACLSRSLARWALRRIGAPPSGEAPGPACNAGEINKFIAPACRRSKRSVVSSVSSRNRPNDPRCGSGRAVGPAYRNP